MTRVLCSLAVENEIPLSCPGQISPVDYFMLEKMVVSCSVLFAVLLLASLCASVCKLSKLKAEELEREW